MRRGGGKRSTYRGKKGKKEDFSATLMGKKRRDKDDSKTLEEIDDC